MVVSYLQKTLATTSPTSNSKSYFAPKLQTSKQIRTSSRSTITTTIVKRTPQRVISISPKGPESPKVSRLSDFFDPNTLNGEMYYIGKAIILFTMFYCTLNWAMYHRIRIDAEKRVDDDKKERDNSK